MKPVRVLSLPLKEMYPLIEETIRAGREITITVRGNSMSPFLHDSRDQAVLASAEGRCIRRGDIVFYQRDSGQFVMHRVYDVRADGVMRFAGDAQWELETGVRPDQIRAFVPRVVRKGKEISCEKGVWHWVMRMYLLRFYCPGLARFGLRVLGRTVALVRKLRCGK